MKIFQKPVLVRILRFGLKTGLDKGSRRKAGLIHKAGQLDILLKSLPGVNFSENFILVKTAKNILLE